MSSPTDEPMFSVVKGSPTDEELAALVAVLADGAWATRIGAGPPTVRVVGVLAVGPGSGDTRPECLAHVGSPAVGSDHERDRRDPGRHPSH